MDGTQLPLFSPLGEGIFAAASSPGMYELDPNMSAGHRQPSWLHDHQQLHGSTPEQRLDPRSMAAGDNNSGGRQGVLQHRYGHSLNTPIPTVLASWPQILPAAVSVHFVPWYPGAAANQLGHQERGGATHTSATPHNAGPDAASRTQFGPEHTGPSRRFPPYTQVAGVRASPGLMPHVGHRQLSSPRLNLLQATLGSVINGAFTMGNEMFQQYSSQLDMPHSMPGAQLLQTATAGLPIPQGPRRAAATTRLQNITFVPKNEDKAYGYVRVIKPTPNLHTRKPAIRPSQAIASHAAFTRARYAVGKPTKPRRLRKYDITLHLWRKNSSRRRRALGMLDSGNRFGALLDLRVALALGYRAADLAGPPRVLQTVGGGELLTAGVVKIRYYVGGDADTLHERDFHVLETLAGGYDVNLPMGEVDPDGQAEGEAEVEGEAEGGEPPVVAWTVQKKREPTEDELRAMAERVREAEAAAERAEEERAVREAAKKAAKKAAKRDKEKEKKSGKGL